ncbi:cobalamin binding intrinsic factor isoform X2 [Lacerta agilis]|uniref:cobalamin binding intrinsic factor isoform X2 n=1 Tax=Lacerta agilis TaxID=80427 RepID=UPI00141A4A09|nr:cobalamin binding intrinsic factor isoform X2 [Lacerta agilis]
MMMGPLLGLVFLLLIQGQCCLDCTVPSAQQWLVTGLQAQLENDVKPSPSVVMALNLAGVRDSSATKQFIQDIKGVKEMTSGKVALYVLALQSSCVDPKDVPTEGGRVNMVSALEEKTDEEIKHYYDTGTPKTTYYQLALDIVALCVEKSPDAENAAAILIKVVKGCQSKGCFGVDTAAMVALALTCVHNRMSKMEGAITETLHEITAQILGSQQESGIIGNIYSTGLAMQALNVTTEFYPAGAWKCSKTIEEVLRKMYEGAFTNPEAGSQILPSLVGKTYLDVATLNCFSDPNITVHYTVINQLIGPYFNYSITVKVPKGSVLLAALEAAQSVNPTIFSFQTESTSWGPMVISIHGVNGSTDDKTYWQFLSGEKPLDQGVGSYKPTDNEHIVAKFSTY